MFDDMNYENNFKYMKKTPIWEKGPFGKKTVNLDKF